MEHGNYVTALHLKTLLLKSSFDAIAIDAEKSWQGPLVQALQLLPAPSVVVRNNHYWLVESVEVTIEALRLSEYLKIPAYFFQPESLTCSPSSESFPAPDHLLALTQNALYHSLFLNRSRSDTDDHSQSWYSAGYLNMLNQKHQNILVLIEPCHLNPVLSALPHGGEWIEWDNPANTARIVPIPSVYYIGLTGEFPLLSSLYEKHRSRLISSEVLYTQLLSEFNCFITSQLKIEALRFSLLRSILQYAYRLAFQDTMLRPGLYHLLKSIRGLTNDELALHFLKLAWTCPYLENLDTPTISSEDENLFYAIAHQQIKNYFNYPTRVEKKLRFSLLPPKPLRQQWAANLYSSYQVSYQPEDWVIENFRHYIFVNSFEFSSIHQGRVEEFRGSMKDGLAFRETIRRFYTHKIFVKEERIHPGKIGAMLIIFDSQTDPYSFRATWYAEHPYESTLCFYATDPSQDMVGPGIGRAFYGGLLMIYPPVFIPNVWDDPFFGHYDNPIDRLVLSALVYSREKYIACISMTPPPDHHRHWANYYKKKLVYIPLSEFSRQKIEKLKGFHVLYHKTIRKYADRFIL